MSEQINVFIILASFQHIFGEILADFFITDRLPAVVSIKNTDFCIVIKSIKTESVHHNERSHKFIIFGHAVFGYVEIIAITVIFMCLFENLQSGFAERRQDFHLSFTANNAYKIVYAV